MLGILRNAFTGPHFNQQVAALIAALGTLLALNSVGDGNATETAGARNVEAANTFAFFQAKNDRQTSYVIARDALGLRLEHDDRMTAAERADVEALVREYTATIDRYESEPDPADSANPLKGEGKVELLARATYLTNQRKEARDRGESFDYGSTFATAGIVVAAAAVLVSSRSMAWAGVVLGVVSLGMLVNALFMVVDVSYVIG